MSNIGKCDSAPLLICPIRSLCLFSQSSKTVRLICVGAINIILRARDNLHSTSESVKFGLRTKKMLNVSTGLSAWLRSDPSRRSPGCRFPLCWHVTLQTSDKDAIPAPMVISSKPQLNPQGIKNIECWAETSVVTASHDVSSCPMMSAVRRATRVGCSAPAKAKRRKETLQDSVWWCLWSVRLLQFFAKTAEECRRQESQVFWETACEGRWLGIRSSWA